ncbi:hypothetical protein [Aromatoleum toluclasticum]|uniref:hypothetical protein n=1 Tax=Aromatoleum toluclasticum TaxID=92003 RepID=UPI00035F6254|nr:hypothetical protein [Aromatoleum toluclasticum]
MRAGVRLQRVDVEVGGQRAFDRALDFGADRCGQRVIARVHAHRLGRRSVGEAHVAAAREHDQSVAQAVEYLLRW